MSRRNSLIPRTTTQANSNAVRLVNSASLASKLGGASNRVFSTFQSAYDAANALQVSLGGATKVLLLVDNTSAAGVGNLTLSASYNQHVIILGISRAVSIVGTITGSATFSVNLTTFHVTVGNITAEAGITLSVENSVIGALTTTSSTGVSGNISISSSTDSTIGAITQNASLGNCGSLTFTDCKHLTVGAIAANQTSTVASFNVGALTMTTCSSIRISTYTATLNFSTGTGIIGGLVINNTNSDIYFTGSVQIRCYNSSAKVNIAAVIQFFTAHNCTFGNTVLLNAHASITRYGGYIEATSIVNCVFHNNVRFNYFPDIPKGSSLRVIGARLLSTTSNHGINVTYDQETFQDITFEHVEGTTNINDTGVINVSNLGTSTSFPTITNVFGTIKNCNVAGIQLDILGPTADPGRYDFQIQNVHAKTWFIQLGFESSVWLSNCSQNLHDTDADSTAIEQFYLFPNQYGADPPVKTSYITNCTLQNWVIDLNTIPTPVNVVNSFVRAQVKSPGLTIPMGVYSSTVDFTLRDVGNNYVLTGTANTSNVVKNAGSTHSMTNNNSYLSSL